MDRKSYRSDLTNKQWQLIEPHLLSEKERGRPRKTNRREVVKRPTISVTNRLSVGYDT